MRILRWVSFCGAVLLALPPAGLAWQSAVRRCPYLDGGVRAFYDAEVGFLPDAQTGDAGPDYSQMDVRIAADLVYLHDVLFGDLNLGVRFDSVLPLRKSGIQMPSHLMALALESRWFWRYVNSTAFELKMAPGIYSSTEDVLDMPLGMPVTAAGVYTVNESLAFVAGLQMRLSFNRVFVPYGGFVWQPRPQLRLDATWPDMRLTYHATQEWAGYAGWLSESTTYHVKPDEAGRNRLTLASQELYAGMSRALNDELRLHGSLGWVTNREAFMTRSRSGNKAKVSIDDALAIRFGVSGAF